MLLDQLTKLLEVELLHNNAGQTTVQGLMQQACQTVDVVERQESHQSILTGDGASGSREHEDVRDHIPVGEHHTLWEASRP